MLNQINYQSIVGQYNEVKSIKCHCCGNQAIVRNFDLCQECELDIDGTISGLDIEEYDELKEAHIGKEIEVVNVDELIWRLTEGYKLVIRCFSKVHGYTWKAAKMFEKEFKFARQFETREHAEKVAAKYQGQVTTQILTLGEAMDLGLI